MARGSDPKARHNATASPAGWAPVPARIRPAWILGGCFLFFVVNHAIWLAHDASSPSYDKAAHALSALRYLRLLEEPTRLSLRRLLEVTEYWPPFFHVSSVPFTMALGFSVSSVAATNVLFLAVAVLAIHRIGWRLYDTWVGTGAVVLALLYPMVYALARDVLVDFALMAMVALSLHLVLSSDGGLNRRRSWLAGLAFGCAMLTKWTAVVFVAGPAILWFVVCLRRDRPRLTAVVTSLAAAALAGAVVALPWYVSAFEKFLEGAAVALGSDPAAEGDPIGVIESLEWYWSAAREVLILRLLLVPTLAGLALWLARTRSWAATGFLLCWIIPPAVFFVLIPNKDGRFVLPMLPALALAAAAGLQAVPWRVFRTIAWAFVVTVGLYQFYAISFGWPVRIDHFYTGPPRHQDWKVEEILGAVAGLDVERPVRIACLPNEPDFEPNIFQLAAAVGRLPVRIEQVGHVREPIGAWTRYDVVISKTGSLSVEHALAAHLQLREDLRAWMNGANRDPHVSLWRTWDLPDGSRAEVYALRSVATGETLTSPRSGPPTRDQVR